MNLGANISAIEILGHGIMWIVLIIITLGIAAFFYPYSLAKFILNRSYVEQGGDSRKITCELDIASQIGHIVLWILLTIVTLGLAYPFYFYKVWAFAINRSKAT